MNLEKLNVVELNAEEVQEVQGGGIFGIIILVAFIAGAWLSQKNMPDRTNVDLTGYSDSGVPDGTEQII